MFSELGLTSNEGKAYGVLLEYGKLSAGEVSKFGNVSYSRVYEVLEGLEQKGLIKIIPEKAKKFVPSSPSELMEIIKKRQKNLEKVKDKINEMRKLYREKTKQPVILGYGKRAFYKLIKEQKSAKKYAYNIKYTSEYRSEWERKYRIRKKKSIVDKNLVRYDEETKKNVKKWIKLGRKDLKRFDNDGVALSVHDGEEVVIGLIKSNTTLLIRDEPFAKIMKQLIDDSYKNAKEIE